MQIVKLNVSLYQIDFLHTATLMNILKSKVEL